VAYVESIVSPGCLLAAVALGKGEKVVATTPSEDPSVVRLRKRGTSVAVALAVASFCGLLLTTMLPGPSSALLLVLVTVSFYYVRCEWRATWPVTASGDRGLVVVAMGVVLAGAFPAFWCTGLVSEPRECVFGGPGVDPLPPVCQSMTRPEMVATIVWGGSIGLTYVALIACMVLTRRSVLGGRVAIPIAMAGCLISFDLAYAAARMS
jgi:hypothetical protein